jgi:phosphoribosylcarboxyaminoimidazole (NCAIR) mutase
MVVSAASRGGTVSVAGAGASTRRPSAVTSTSTVSGSPVRLATRTGKRTTSPTTAAFGTGVSTVAL